MFGLGMAALDSYGQHGLHSNSDQQKLPAQHFPPAARKWRHCGPYLRTLLAREWIGIGFVVREVLPSGLNKLLHVPLVADNCVWGSGFSRFKFRVFQHTRTIADRSQFLRRPTHHEQNTEGWQKQTASTLTTQIYPDIQEIAALQLKANRPAWLIR